MDTFTPCPYPTTAVKPSKRPTVPLLPANDRHPAMYWHGKSGLYRRYLQYAREDVARRGFDYAEGYAAAWRIHGRHAR